MSALLLTLTLLAAHGDSEAAFQDLAQFPAAEQPYYAYLTLTTTPEADRERLANVLRFVVPSLSSRTLLSEQLPTPVAGTNLLRLDLRGLGWESVWQSVIKTHYVPKYRPDLLASHAVPLVIRGDWLASNLMDPIETGDAQYQLIYSGKPPKTAGEFLAFWGIQSDPEYVFGLIEGASGVAEERVRLIENRPGAKRNYGWLTRDSAIVAGKTDPLENLPNRAKFDAQELIVGAPKWYGGKSGMLQAYFLADGKGNRQEKAPADIVVDHTQLRGVEIRNSIGCVSCHIQGINPPTTDVFRAYIESGARVFADKITQREIDRYLGSDVAKEVTRDQQSYADGVKLCNGLTPEANTAAFVATVKQYDQPLDLEQAARELYAGSAIELRLALGDYSRRFGLSGRLALLAQGKTISRPQWIANFGKAQEIVAAWTAGK
jgi:hypothetical protein